MSNTKYDFLIKLLLIGDSGVGKSCLLLRFCESNFNPSFITTIGIDFKIRTIEIDGKKIKVQIWDTAGQERFRTITTAYYRGSHGILLVYDITDKKSFDNVTNWMRQLQNHASPSVSVFLVGNKCDLNDKREISYCQGYEKANDFGSFFIETSAKTGFNVEDAFIKLINIVYENIKESKIRTQTHDDISELLVFIPESRTETKYQCC